MTRETRTWGLYVSALLVLCVTFGFVAVALPEQLGAAWRPLLIAGLIGVLFVVIIPPSRLALEGRAKSGTARGAQVLPFSESLAARILALLSSVRRMLGVVALYLAVGSSFAALTSVVPGWQHLETASGLVLGVGTIVVSLLLAVAVFRDVERLRKAIPADAAERRRNQLLRNRYSGLGIYRNAADPMLLVILPANPANITINLAHEQGTRVLWTMLGWMAAFVVVTIAVSVG